MSLREKYAAIFATECANTYPVMDALEKAKGFSVETAKLQAAAEVLACPLKVNPPNWQHGRLIYAVARHYLAANPAQSGIFLDIGTAKGFSACVMTWAIEDAGADIPVVSIDVIDPYSTERRNSVGEIDSPKTLREFVAPFQSSASSVTWLGGGSSAWFKSSKRPRVLLAFVDGKHTFEAVLAEGNALRDRQERGDIVIYDDAQISAVRTAAEQVRGYVCEHVWLSPKRSYIVAVRT